jgi:hypothetical protein
VAFGGPVVLVPFGCQQACPVLCLWLQAKCGTPFVETACSAYGRFVSLAREFTEAVDTERTAVKNLERIGRQRDRIRSSSADLEISAEAAEQLVADPESADADWSANTARRTRRSICSALPRSGRRLTSFGAPRARPHIPPAVITWPHEPHSSTRYARNWGSHRSRRPL